MVGAGILMIAVSAWGLWLGRGRRFLESRWFRRAALAGIGLPVLANASGWIFTEAGRQPWIVYGLMQTASGVSSVPAADIAFTMAVFVEMCIRDSLLSALVHVVALSQPGEELVLVLAQLLSLIHI